jgi:hypothetical protein
MTISAEYWPTILAPLQRRCERVGVEFEANRARRAVRQAVAAFKRNDAERPAAVEWRTHYRRLADELEAAAATLSDVLDVEGRADPLVRWLTRHEDPWETEAAADAEAELERLRIAMLSCSAKAREAEAQAPKKGRRRGDGPALRLVAPMAFAFATVTRSKARTTTPVGDDPDARGDFYEFLKAVSAALGREAPPPSSVRDALKALVRSDPFFDPPDRRSAAEVFGPLIRALGETD